MAQASDFMLYFLHAEHAGEVEPRGGVGGGWSWYKEIEQAVDKEETTKCGPRGDQGRER